MAFPYDAHLYSIPYSHYNEKARWMMDVSGIPFTRHDFLPLLHVPVVRRLQAAFRTAGKRDAASSAASTPSLALYTPAGETVKLLTDSADIGRFAAAHRTVGGNIYDPADDSPACGDVNALRVDADVAALEKQFHDKLGTSVRLYTYFWLLPGWIPSPQRYLNNYRLFIHNLPIWQAAFAIIILPVFAAILNAAFGLTATRAQAARDKILAQCDDVEARLRASGTGFLVGSRLTAADITFAALLYPVLGVSRADGLGAWSPPIADMPPAFAHFVRGIRERPAGEYALRLFAQHRHSPAARR